MDLQGLAEEIKGFEGVKRKKGIGLITKDLGIKENYVKPHFGDDAAVIEFEDRILLFACDSINEKLVDADPYFAGYSAVLVNLNDIAAMGGRAIAMADVLSARDDSTAHEITMGLKDASHKFGVPIVGGHFNPNSAYNGVEVSVVGEAKGEKIIKGDSASPGEVIIAAIDLDGKPNPGYKFAWDSTSKKSSKEVRENLSLPIKIADIVKSGRDISNPGIIGTVGMLLEQSGVGGKIDLENIPHPKEVEFSHWLKMYPGFGFVFTSKKSDVPQILEIFQNRGISAETIGEVIQTPKLFISWREEEAEVFDFKKESITGV
jgi:putative methanogenesis marker protein 2